MSLFALTAGELRAQVEVSIRQVRGTSWPVFCVQIAPHLHGINCQCIYL